MPFVKAAHVNDVPEGMAKQVSVNGKDIALFQSGGQFYALDAVCSHRNAPLAEGFVEGTELECPWHGARFDLATGAALCRPAPRGVKSYPVQIVGEEVQVEI